MSRPKQVDLLLAKASQDEYVLDKLLPDPDAPLEIFGFHAQQAAEKLLKAVLALRGIAYPRTHRLAELIDLARARGLDLPDHLEEVRHLTPFAVEFRYDPLPEESEDPLDKPATRELIGSLRSWVEAMAEDGADEPRGSQ